MIKLWAGRYKGIPFKEKGRDRAGLDDWGLVRLVLAEQFDLAVHSFAREDDDTILASLVPPSWKEVDTPEIGDIVTLKNSFTKGYLFGICVGDDAYLTCAKGVGAVRVGKGALGDKIVRYEPFISYTQY